MRLSWRPYIAGAPAGCFGAGVLVAHLLYKKV